MFRRSIDFDRYKIVSFDIFDTLIEREVWVPQKVFSIVGIRVLGERSGKEFCNARVTAERNAREKSITGEVNLSDIYDSLEGYDHLREKLMFEEMNVELEMCKQKVRGHELYRKAIEQGKRVILISDMYLSSTFLLKMLGKCGINEIEKLYVSCENGCSKRSGLLFGHVLIDEDVLPKNIIHIGDDYTADVKGSGMNGIDSIWLWDFKCIISKIMQKFDLWR